MFGLLRPSLHGCGLEKAVATPIGSCRLVMGAVTAAGGCGQETAVLKVAREGVLVQDKVAVVAGVGWVAPVCWRRGCSGT